MPTAIAIGGAALVGGGASVLAANKAAKTATQANDQATALQREQFNYAQQANAPYLAAGSAALGKLTGQLGIGQTTATGGFGATLSGASAISGPDWNAYLAAYPDVAQQYSTLSPGYLQSLGISSPQEFAQYHYQTAGQQEGRQLTTPGAPTQAANPTPDAAPTAPTIPTPFGQALANGSTQYAYSGDNTARPVIAARPDLGTAPAYQTPQYRETQFAPLDVSRDAFNNSADYQIAQNAINTDSDAVKARLAATGGVQSGAAQKELQRIGINDILNVGYNPFRTATTSQYNADRAFGQSADAAYNGFNLNNAQFGANLGNQQYQYATNLGQQNYNTDRAFGQDLYNIDRTNYQSQQQQGIQNLFNVAGLGTGATASNINAGQNMTNTASQGLLSSAAATGNAGLAAAGQFGSVLQTGANALAYYGPQNAAYRNTTPLDPTNGGLAGLY